VSPAELMLNIQLLLEVSEATEKMWQTNDTVFINTNIYHLKMEPKGRNIQRVLITIVVIYIMYKNMLATIAKPQNRASAC
jgi:hypothetical protein